MLLPETVPQLAQLEGPENTPISPISPARYRQMKESIRQRTADAWIRFVEAVFVQLYLNADNAQQLISPGKLPFEPTTPAPRDDLDTLIADMQSKRRKTCSPNP